MAEKDLPSNSDESDEDFVPGGNPTSDEDSVSGHTEDESNDEKEPKSKKRRKLSKKKKKGGDESKTSDENEENPVKTTDVDALWADFKQDVSKMERKAAEEKLGDRKSLESKDEKPDEGNSNKISMAGGEGKKRSFPSAANSGSKLGINKILNQLGKKEKMSTLAKSKLDWNNFKKSEGIEEEIKTHNRGKDGYLEKQDFLQRTDLRQFEIEKQLRASRKHY